MLLPLLTIVPHSVSHHCALFIGVLDKQWLEVVSPVRVVGLVLGRSRSRPSYWIKLDLPTSETRKAEYIAYLYVIFVLLSFNEQTHCGIAHLVPKLYW